VRGASGNGRPYRDLILQYIGKGPVRVSRRVVRDTLYRLMPEKLKMSDEEGFLEECERLGFEKGTADSLIQVLELRFGPLANQFRDRILNADVPSMQAWLTRAIKESNLDAVFK